MADINQLNIIDLDVYGRNSQSGGALVHSDDFAISNAIVFYLTSAKGDYLYRSDLGGDLKALLFKLLDEEMASSYSYTIKDILNKKFGAIVEDIDVSVVPNFIDRYYEVQVFYKSKRTSLTNQVLFYTKPKTSTEQINYVDVYFTDDNLLAFVTLQMDQGLNKPLIYNSSDGYWYWNLFRLINFNQESSNFEEIYNMINKE